MEPEFTYSDLCELIAGETKRAYDRGLFVLEDGGASFLAALEALEATPAALEKIVRFAGELIEKKNEAPNVDSTSEERAATRVAATTVFYKWWKLIETSLSVVYDGAPVMLAPNVIAFLLPLFVPYEEWNEN